MAEDISRKAVIMLVVLSVVISILSTTFVLNAAQNFNPSPVQVKEARGNPTGIISFNVPDGDSDGSRAATGEVVFIVK